MDSPSRLPGTNPYLNKISPNYYKQKGNIIYFITGKMDSIGSGCDGPEDHIVRDFNPKKN